MHVTSADFVRFFTGAIDAGGVLTKEIPQNSSLRNSKKGSSVAKEPLKASKIKLGPSKSTPSASIKNGTSPKDKPDLPKPNQKETPASDPKPTSSPSNLSARFADKRILLKCPMSTKEQICKKCSISKGDSGSPQDTVFRCHCGGTPVTLPKGRCQNVEAHWESCQFKLF
jgi:hypothetical protein